MHRLQPALLFALALLAFTTGSGRCEEARLAISGYDPVAYFTDSKPVPGQKNLEYVWHNQRWRFSKTEHRDLFVRDPDRYAPQFDGYCAMGVAGVAAALAHKDTVDPEAWAIVDGKLYLTHTKGSLDRWREQMAENIRRGEQNWQFVKAQAEPEIVGPPCIAEPPTVIVTTIDDKRKLIVGRQVALDETGKLVGRGDLAAQLQQVSKNVDRCLQAAGATEADLVFTRTYVSDKSLLLKHKELRSRYLAPDGPESTLMEKPDFAGPDFLIGVEALAAIK